MRSARADLVDSGVPWLGPVPATWKARPLWSMFERIKDIDHPEEQMLSVFREHGVVAKDSRDNINKTAENRSIYQLIHPGWLVANRMKAWQGSVGISSLRGIVSGHYICFAPRHNEDHRYLNWLLRSTAYTNGYALLSRGVRIGQAEIDNDELRLMPILLPPREEQRAIADYLDHETAPIDTLIAKQEQLIATLHERRDAAWSVDYQRLVSATPMVPLRRVVDSIVDGPFGSSLTSAHYTDSGARVIRLGNIGINEFRESDAAFISLDYYAELDNHAAEAGDVVIAGLGDDRMPLGRSAVVPDLGPAIVKADCYRVRPSGALTAPYLAWALSAPPSRVQIAQLARGATRARLNTAVVRDVAIPLPTLEQQRAVVKATARVASSIEALTARAERFIELSKERRAALITAAVTGQIDVRAST